MHHVWQKRIIVLFLGVWLAMGSVTAEMVYADKSSVRIDAPEQAAAGETITVVLHVTHEGNNFLHYTDWVSLRIDGAEVERWEFGSFSKPEAAEFSREFTYTVADSVEISAEAHCNLHGSQGVARKRVTVIPKSLPANTLETQDNP